MAVDPPISYLLGIFPFRFLYLSAFFLDPVILKLLPLIFIRNVKLQIQVPQSTPRPGAPDLPIQGDDTTTALL
jgi:hypothetical protein